MAATAMEDVSAVVSSSARNFIRGSQLLRQYDIERFPFLVQQKPKVQQSNANVWQPPIPESDEARYLHQDMQNRSKYPYWAPTDMGRPNCSTYAKFQQLGLDAYEVAFSLVGHNGTPRKPAPKEVVSNAFAKTGYSYIHMPFQQLATFLGQLHPDDRFLAYILPDQLPVHIYFDIDAEFAKFPWIKGREEECLRRFMRSLKAFFEQTFKRRMDVSGLMLLQASSDVKMS
jgi:hypothetical protein